MRRIDAGAAILLAASRCPADRRLRDLPGVAAGLDAVRTGIAADPRGFSPGRIYVLDPTERAERLTATFGAIAAAVTGPIVVYLGGHLLADPRTRSLHLALAGSRRETVRYTGLPLEWVTRTLRGDGGRLAIVFLDIVWHQSATAALRLPRSRAAAELRPDGVTVIAPPTEGAPAALAAARRGRATPFGRDLAAGLRVGVAGWLRVHAGSVALPVAEDEEDAAEAPTVRLRAGEPPRPATMDGQARPAHALPLTSRGPVYRGRPPYQPRHALPAASAAPEDVTGAADALALVAPHPPAATSPPTPASADVPSPTLAEPAASADSADSAAGRRELAHQAWLAGDRTRALELLRALVADLDGGLPASAQEALGVRELLAHCVGESGAPAEAAQLFRDVCQDRLARSGPADHACQQALDNFHIWWRRTPVGAGMPLAADLVKLRAEVNGEDHPATRAARAEVDEASALVGGDAAHKS